MPIEPSIATNSLRRSSVKTHAFSLQGLTGMVIGGYLFAGTLLYESTPLLKFTDELFVAILSGWTLMFYFDRVLKYWKPLTILALSAAAYGLYSAKLGVNSPHSIAQDLVVSLKPWLTFLLIITSGYQLNTLTSQWIFRVIALFIAFATFLIALLGEQAISKVFFHESRFYSAAVISALVYLLSQTQYRWSSFFISISIISIGLVSLKAKFLGEWIVFLALSAYFVFSARNVRLPMRLKWLTSERRMLLLAPILIAVAIWIAWEKIEFYFITGIQNDDSLFARPALYIKSIEILRDYMPWGSGLASFGSFFSAHDTYSTLYDTYGLSQLHGLSEENPIFIADTYFPMLIAQFGLPGLTAFTLFFIWIRRLIRRYGNPPYRPSPALLVISFIPVVLLIESIADATLAQNRGVLYMTLLAMAINQYRSGIYGAPLLLARAPNDISGKLSPPASP